MDNVDKVVSVAEINLPLLVEETGVAVTAVAFTSNSSGDDTETLVITPRGPCHKMVVIINEVSGGGDLAVNCEAGSFWAGQAMKEVEVASGKSRPPGRFSGKSLAMLSIGGPSQCHRQLTWTR